MSPQNFPPTTRLTGILANRYLPGVNYDFQSRFVAAIDLVSGFEVLIYSQSSSALLSSQTKPSDLGSSLASLLCFPLDSFTENDKSFLVFPLRASMSLASFMFRFDGCLEKEECHVSRWIYQLCLVFKSLQENGFEVELLTTENIFVTSKFELFVPLLALQQKESTELDSNERTLKHTSLLRNLILGLMGELNLLKNQENSAKISQDLVDFLRLISAENSDEQKSVSAEILLSSNWLRKNLKTFEALSIPEKVRRRDLKGYFHCTEPRQFAPTLSSLQEERSVRRIFKFFAHKVERMHL
eukprot:TRINITY_DN6511_c0_g1_i1.p1 TRINITY_DN6511_c0_g1~~TRINITY_DN6511_c0_g1_i1.p1  ORF type:complete len:310 (-),score=72.73 TRINITY_DN6511_c0_g1_i1:27-923(-)